MNAKIYVLRPMFGFTVVSHPQLRELRGAAEYDKTCSRWQPRRVTISGEAAHLLAEAAADYDMTPRALLEAMLQHGFSGLNRPGSWEASMPFDPLSYGAGEHGYADRWFR